MITNRQPEIYTLNYALDSNYYISLLIHFTYRRFPKENLAPLNLQSGSFCTFFSLTFLTSGVRHGDNLLMELTLSCHIIKFRVVIHCFVQEICYSSFYTTDRGQKITCFLSPFLLQVTWPSRAVLRRDISKSISANQF